MAYQGLPLKAGDVVRHKTEDWYGVVLKQRLPEEPNVFWVLRLVGTYCKAQDLTNAESYETAEAWQILGELRKIQ